METMDRSKVTSAALRGMRTGETVAFGPMAAPLIDSGKTIAYRMGRILGCTFKASSDFERGILTIKKQERL